MTFGAPTFLWLALLAPGVALAAAWLWRRRLEADAAWAARGLWNRLFPDYAPRRLALSVATLALAVLGLSLALARPRWGAGEQKVERKGVDVVFVVDSSLSMAAPDAAPSRLFVAKSLVRRMALQMPGNRVGLVQTEGDSLALAPLTLDGGVIDLLLDAIDPGSLPEAGTALAPGVETALKLFGEGSEKHRVLVIVSDGEDHAGGLTDEVRRLKDEGVVVFAFGVGTPQGSSIPIPGTGGELKRDADGSTVITRLHEEGLEQLARSTGGLYLRATSAATDTTPVLQRIDRMEKRTIESQSLSTLEERFQWPLALAALALMVHLGAGAFGGEKEEKRDKRDGRDSRDGRQGRSRAAAFAFAGWLFLPALPWQPHLPTWVERWMYNPRERTERSIEAYGNGKPKEAVGPADTALRLAPGDPMVQYDAGTAHLAAGSSRKAMSILEKAAKGAGPELAPVAHYNLGNARLAAGDAAGAVQAYRRTLLAQPGNLDAKYNLEIALREEKKQKMGARGNPAGSRGSRSKNQDPSNQQGRGNNPQPNQNNPQDRNQPPNPQPGQQPKPGEGDPQNRAGQGQQDQRLPRFRNQPEMNAREAASLLSAVEDLERQQRRDQAARRARQHAAQGKDW
ncbi:MAG: VWA domain-containing protein [Thermoanaerobaculia bacterium]